MIDYKVIAVVGFIAVVTGGVTISSLLLSNKTKNPTPIATPKVREHEQVLGTKSTPEINQDKLYGLINGYRREQGKTILKAHKSLEISAQYKLSDMIAKKYWRHENADNQDPWQFFTQAGYAYSRAGENLSFGTTSAWETLEKNGARAHHTTPNFWKKLTEIWGSLLIATRTTNMQKTPA